MAELVRGGLFVRGFPPDSGDHIGLEIDGEVSEFCIYRVRDKFHCEEIREANPRHLRYSEDDLTMHTLVRTRFYEFVAKDLGITGQVIELGNGIWELGRKRLPGRDSSKVIFIEAGVPAAALELTLMRDPFMTLCLLHHGKSPMHDWHSDKTLFRGVIEVRDGRYASDVFEDLSESQQESSSAARVELEALITASSGRSCRDESQFNFSSECGSRLAETGDGEGWIPGIENTIQGSPTGFHAGGELSLRDVFLFQDLLKLERHHTLECEHFDFGPNSLIYEEVAEITSAMDVLVCFGFHFRCSFM